MTPARVEGRPPTRAVILAAGRGTRMQRDDGTSLAPDQAAAASRGLKTLIPIQGHPFLAYVLHELADAGITDVCLVVGPGDDDPVRAAALALPLRRLRTHFAVQREPRGAADALLAAEPVVGRAPFLMLNADNLYPAAVIAGLRELHGPGLAAFDPGALVRESNIPADRVAAFAVIRVDDEMLADIVEKPDPDTVRAMAGAPVSMNIWRFDPDIFEACRAAPVSPRGEVELPDAVRKAMETGTRFRALPVAAGVLDLSTRADIPAVERRLAGRKPTP